LRWSDSAASPLRHSFVADPVTPAGSRDHAPRCAATAFRAMRQRTSRSGPLPFEPARRDRDPLPARGMPSHGQERNESPPGRPDRRVAPGGAHSVALLKLRWHVREGCDEGSSRSGRGPGRRSTGVRRSNRRTRPGSPVGRRGHHRGHGRSPRDRVSSERRPLPDRLRRRARTGSGRPRNLDASRRPSTAGQSGESWLGGVASRAAV
jgi:hypothetical protein